MHSECGVVAAAVFRMEHQTQIQQFCFQTGIFAVRTHHIQNVFRNGKLRVRLLDKHASVVAEVHRSLIAEHCQRRELGHQLDTLPHYVGQAGIIGLGVIGMKCQHALCHCVHDIVAGHLHNNAAVKVVGQYLIVCQQPLELCQLVGFRQMSHEQQIDDLLEAKAVVGNKALHQLFNGDPAVQQLSGCGNFPAVYDLGSGHLADRGQTGTYPFTVQIAKATLDFVLFIKFLFDLVVGFCICGQLVYQLHVVFILCDHLLDLCRMQQFFFFHLISPLLSEQRFRLFGLHIVQILLLESSA